MSSTCPLCTLHAKIKTPHDLNKAGPTSTTGAPGNSRCFGKQGRLGLKTLKVDSLKLFTAAVGACRHRRH